MRSQGRHFTRRQETIYPAEIQRPRVPVFRGVFNLHLIPSPQINARVGSFLVTEFGDQLKIFKPLLTYQVGTGFFVNQYTVFHYPLAVLARCLPSVSVITIE